MRWVVFSLFVGLSLSIGCDDSATSNDEGTEGKKAMGLEKPPEPPPPPGVPIQPDYPVGGGSWDNPQVKRKSDGSERVKAEVGVGKKGRRLDDPKLVQTIVVPARTLFNVQEWMVFDVKLKKALDFYKAERGYFPRSHREFVDNIIIPNQIELPQLPKGQRYIFDPKAGQLMVEKPAR